MRITLVGVRDNRRVINWPGLCAAAAIVVALGLVGFFGAQQVLGLFGGTPS